MTSLSLDATLVANDDHTTTTIDGEIVILNSERGLYQGFDEVGTHVWELLQEPTTVREVRDAVTAKYDVSTEQCEQDLLAFLSEIEAEGLVDIDDEPN